MKYVLVAALLTSSCAQAAYEVIHPRKHTTPTAEIEPPPPPPEQQGPPVVPKIDPPPVQPSVPPVKPGDLDPDTPVQQEPPQCNEVTVCSRRQLPACNKSNSGIFGRVLGQGLFVCEAGEWREVDDSGQGD